jgi:cytochrome c oxidase subunit 3
MADKFEYGTTGRPHPYHIVRPSIWPMVGALFGGVLAMGLVLFMHKVEIGPIHFGYKGIAIGLLGVLAVMFFWWKDVIFESVTEKAHNKITEVGLRYGMALFIASEVMFFVAFFWAFFSASLFPTEAIGFVWPPETIKVFDPFHLPLLMTLVLLLSGCTVTWAHHAVMIGDNKSTVQALGWSVFLGVFFTILQAYEYGHAYFGFTDTIYASTFYLATGFHGFHVIVGTIFLAVCWFRAMKGHFTPEKHFGFEAAAWYWHFVDVVWLFLFISIYWWGGLIGTDHTKWASAIKKERPAIEASAEATDAVPATAPAAAPVAEPAAAN